MIIDVFVIILVYLFGEKLVYLYGLKFMYNMFMGFELCICGYGIDVY